MANSNPLVHPPFFLIPGIDPSSPISAQTEQIDQLNTLLLQEIDANFARIHQIITTRILPEIKRFAIASEPTRGAADFWRSFFEAAASTRLPSSELSFAAETSEEDHDDHTLTMRPEDSYVQEDSLVFQPVAAGVTTSTPMPSRTGVPTGFDESWSESMESPFDRLDRKLRDELRLGGEEDSSGIPTPSLPSGYDLPELDGMSSVGDVSTGTAPLRHREAGSPPSSATAETNRSEGANASYPYQPAPTGVVDLRSTPLNAKLRPKPGLKLPKMSLADLELELADDDLRLTMSPPVTMTFNLPPRAAAIQAAGQTPAKAMPKKDTEARFILDDLMEEMQHNSPRLATPEGLGRYSILPSELANGTARQLFPSGTAIGVLEEADAEATFRRTGTTHQTRRSMANTSFDSDIQDVPEQVVYSNDETFDASNDSFDSIAGPSGYAPPQDLLGDDSYMSDLAWPLPAGQTGRIAYDAGDMTFSTDGGTPNRSEAGLLFGGPADAAARGFALMKPDDMVTFHGGRLEDAEAQPSPTNLMRGK